MDIQSLNQLIKIRVIRETSAPDAIRSGVRGKILKAKLFFAQLPSWGARTYARTSEPTYFKPNPANLKKLNSSKSTKTITFFAKLDTFSTNFVQNHCPISQPSHLFQIPLQ